MGATLIISCHEDQPVHDPALPRKIFLCAIYKTKFLILVEMWDRSISFYRSSYSQGSIHLSSPEQSALFNQSEVGQCITAGEDRMVSFMPVSQAARFAD